MEIPPHLLLLLPLSVAAGVDLYLTLLVIGGTLSLGLDIPWGTAVPLSRTAPVLLLLAGLYVAEAIAGTRPFVVLVWHNLQLLLRPLGAGLLGLFILRGESLGTMLLGAAMASIVAAFAHVLVWGQEILLRIIPDRRLSPATFNLVGDLAALCLLALALARPDLGILFATLLLVLGLILGRNRHCAVRFGLTLLLGRVWGIVSPSRWQTEAEIPAWVRRGIGPETGERLRGAKAATWGIVGPGRFRDGWILQGNHEILFAYRQGRAPRFIGIEGSEEGIQSGAICKALLYRTSGGASSALFLQLGLIGPESHK